MLFSSITFIYLFLPICLILYYITPNKYKNYTLLLFSLLFYSFETPKFIIMMFFSMLATYINGLIINKYRNKIHFIFSILLSLSPLLFFKYTDFFIDNINSVFNLDISLLKLVLPLGISFYTFQMLTYLVDVYKKEVSVEKNPFRLFLYVSFFPQLIAGPILKYKDVSIQIKERTHSFEKFSEGAFIFAVGLGKKVLIANQLGEICNYYNINDTTIILTWLYALAYTMQVYFDFSGYSTMAIGLGKMFGFNLPMNFNYPFICKSIQDFWRRWHITLSSFFKEYVYIPMGGSRVSNKRYILNMLTVWLLTGFWHGAAWNFILWGLFFFVLLITEKFIIKDRLNPIIQRILSLLLIIFSFILFGSIDLVSAITTIKQLFVGNFINPETIFVVKNYLFILIIAAIGSTPLFNNIYEKKIKNSVVSIPFEIVFIVSILLISTAFLVDGSFNPFLYFRF